MGYKYSDFFFLRKLARKVSRKILLFLAFPDAKPSSLGPKYTGPRKGHGWEKKGVFARSCKTKGFAGSHKSYAGSHKGFSDLAKKKKKLL